MAGLHNLYVHVHHKFRKYRQTPLMSGFVHLKWLQYTKVQNSKEKRIYPVDVLESEVSTEWWIWQDNTSTLYFLLSLGLHALVKNIYAYVTFACSMQDTAHNAGC